MHIREYELLGAVEAFLTVNNPDLSVIDYDKFTWNTMNLIPGIVDMYKELRKAGTSIDFNKDQRAEIDELAQKLNAYAYFDDNAPDKICGAVKALAYRNEYGLSSDSNKVSKLSETCTASEASNVRTGNLTIWNTLFAQVGHLQELLYAKQLLSENNPKDDENLRATIGDIDEYSTETKQFFNRLIDDVNQGKNANEDTTQSDVHKDATLDKLGEETTGANREELGVDKTHTATEAFKDDAGKRTEFEATEEEARKQQQKEARKQQKEARKQQKEARKQQEEARKQQEKKEALEKRRAATTKSKQAKDKRRAKKLEIKAAEKRLEDARTTLLNEEQRKAVGEVKRFTTPLTQAQIEQRKTDRTATLNKRRAARQLKDKGLAEYRKKNFGITLTTPQRRATWNLKEDQMKSVKKKKGKIVKVGTPLYPKTLPIASSVADAVYATSNEIFSQGRFASTPGYSVHRNDILANIIKLEEDQYHLLMGCFGSYRLPETLTDSEPGLCLAFLPRALEYRDRNTQIQKLVRQLSLDVSTNDEYTVSFKSADVQKSSRGKKQAAKEYMDDRAKLIEKLFEAETAFAKLQHATPGGATGSDDEIIAKAVKAANEEVDKTQQKKNEVKKALEAALDYARAKEKELTAAAEAHEDAQSKSDASGTKTAAAALDAARQAHNAAANEAAKLQEQDKKADEALRAAEEDAEKAKKIVEAQKQLEKEKAALEELKKELETPADDDYEEQLKLLEGHMGNVDEALKQLKLKDDYSSTNKGYGSKARAAAKALRAAGGKSDADDNDDDAAPKARSADSDSDADDDPSAGGKSDADDNDDDAVAAGPSTTPARGNNPDASNADATNPGNNPNNLVTPARPAVQVKVSPSSKKARPQRETAQKVSKMDKWWDKGQKDLKWDNSINFGQQFMVALDNKKYKVNITANSPVDGATNNKVFKAINSYWETKTGTDGWKSDWKSVGKNQCGISFVKTKGESHTLTLSYNSSKGPKNDIGVIEANRLTDTNLGLRVLPENDQGIESAFTDL